MIRISGFQLLLKWCQASGMLWKVVTSLLDACGGWTLDINVELIVDALSIRPGLLLFSIIYLDDYILNLFKKRAVAEI